MLDKQTLDTVSKNILSEYNSGTMASERHLQAVIYNILRPLLPKGLSILIEPNIITKPKHSLVNGLIPDMLIIDQNKVRGIVEIKYVPYAYPKFQKDFETFVAFHSTKENNGAGLYLKGQPKDGNWDENVLFTIAQDLHTYYIVIARHDSDIFTKTSSIVKKYLDSFKNNNFQPIFILINPENDPSKSEIRLLYDKT